MNHSFSHMFAVKKFYNIKATPEGVAEGAEKPQSPAEQLKQAQDHQRNLVQVTKALKDQGVDWNDPQYQQAKETYMKSLDRSQEIVSAAKNDAVEAHNKFNDAVQKAPNATEAEKKEAISARNGEIAGLEMDALKAKKDAKETSLNNQQAVQATVEDKYGDSEEGDEYPTSGTLTPEQAAKEVRAEADALRDKILKENVAKAQGNPTETSAEGGTIATAAATEGAKNEDSFIQKREDGSEFAVKTEIKEKLRDHSLRMSNLKFTPEGNLSDEDLSKFLANFDDDNTIEVQNVSGWARAFKGMGRQTDIAGESQTLGALQFYTKMGGNIQELYQRLTGDSSPLVITRKDVEGKIGLDDKSIARQKVQNFQRELLQRTSDLADIMGIITSPNGTSKIPGVNVDVRAGLASVINGREAEFLSFLNNPANEATWVKLVNESGVIQDKPGWFEKVAKTLVKFGLSATVGVLSKGIVGAKLETEDLTSTGYEKTTEFDLAGGKIRKEIGENGSVAANLDLAGLNLEANWNDPKTTIHSVLRSFNKEENKQKAVEELVAKMNTIADKEGGKKAEEIRQLGEAFRTGVTKLLAQVDALKANPNDPNLRAKLKRAQNAIDSKVSIYTASVLDATGVNLKGVYGNVSMAGLAAGLSAVDVDVSASFDNVSEGGAKIEALINKTEVNSEKIHAFLSELGVNKEGNTYRYKDSPHPLLVLGENEEVGWNITRTGNDKEVTTIIEAYVRDKNTKQVRKLQFTLDNMALNNSVVEQNSRDFASALDKAKKTAGANRNTEIRRMQHAAVDGDYESALKHADGVFAKTPMAEKFQQALAEAGNDPYKRYQLSQILLNKTSGGDHSHGIADAFNSGKADYSQTSQAILEYYKNGNPTLKKGKIAMAELFGRQYGLSKQSVIGMAEKMLSGGTKETAIGTLGGNFNSFMGMVAFNQKGNSFDRLAPIMGSNIQIFGKPAKVENPAEANLIRTKLKSMLPKDQVDRAVQQYLQEKPEAKNDPNLVETVKNYLVSGNVYSYLSYEQDAECFNLGFTVEPGSLEFQNPLKPLMNSVTSGYTVGREKATATTGGLHIGYQKKPDNPPDEPPTTTPGEGTAATIAGAKGREIGEVAGNLTKSTADAVAKNVTSGNLMDDILKGF